MQKDFLDWGNLKEKLHTSQKNVPYFNEREIWWCSLGVNVGYEQDGKNCLYERPVLVLKKFNKDILWVIPLTSRIDNRKFAFPLSLNNKTQTLILSQLRLISSKRLLRKAGSISRDEFGNIKNRLLNLLQS